MLETSKIPERTRGNNPVADDAIVESRLEAEAAPQNGIDWMELLLILSRRKKTILQVTIAVAVITAIVMFLIPNTYTATATICAAGTEAVHPGRDAWTDRIDRRVERVRPGSQESGRSVYRHAA